MYVALLVRKLRPGKSYQDFLDAWYPDRGYGIDTQVSTAVNINDETEVLVFSQHAGEGHTRESLSQALLHAAAEEARRRDQIDEVVESTRLGAFYEVQDHFDFTSDETVAAGRR